LVKLLCCGDPSLPLGPPGNLEELPVAFHLGLAGLLLLSQRLGVVISHDLHILTLRGKLSPCKLRSREELIQVLKRKRNKKKKELRNFVEVEKKVKK